VPLPAPGAPSKINLMACPRYFLGAAKGVAVVLALLCACSFNLRIARSLCAWLTPWCL
jgi:hypothetical protein